jgi:hypothetical protein
VWAPEPVWTTWRGENLAPAGDSISDSWTIQPIVTHHTHCAILALVSTLKASLNNTQKTGKFSVRQPERLDHGEASTRRRRRKRMTMRIDIRTPGNNSQSLNSRE